MKDKIHLQYYPDAKVRCNCGNIFTTGSTKPEIKTETCFQCHPFYTGQEKIFDRQGQVQKFKERLAKKQKPVKK